MVTLCFLLALWSGPATNSSDTGMSFIDYRPKPSELKYLRRCEEVTMAQAFTALGMSRSDPALVCVDSYNLTMHLVTILCRRP